MTTDYRSLAVSYAQQAGISPSVFVNQIQQESGFNPSATSPAGAIGIAQFMPMTAQSIGLNPYDPVASLKAAALYDKQKLQAYNGDYAKMLAAYNAGDGTVQNAIARGGNNWLSLTPNETQNYVKVILGNSSNVTTPTLPTSSTGVVSGILDGSLVQNLQIYAEYAAIFLLALLLMIVGVMLLAGPTATRLAKKAVKL